MSTRVFVNQECAPEALVSLEAVDVRHLKSVLRLKPGDDITIVGRGKSWQAKLETVEPDRIAARVIGPSTQIGELPGKLIVLQAMPKGNKMDDVIEKVTELGAARIVPIRAERSYGSVSATKLGRWRRIARAAAAQAQRSIIPAVDNPLELLTALEKISVEAQLIVAWEKAPPGSLASAVSGCDKNASFAIVIGPEGSFSDDELSAARRLNARFVSLGPTTLRTETAAAATIAAIASLLGWW